MGKFLQDKVVLVTGAGGSIGSELCRQIMRQEPAVLVMLDNSELALYNIDREINHPWAVPVLGDVSDDDDVQRIFARYFIDVVFHAAAYKHVRICEENQGPAWRVNVQGTANILIAAQSSKHPVRVVLISTDKAVHPQSMMGKTKERAEYYTRRYNQTVVRLGNVRGSSGSVLPLWKEQIANNVPVTITDPDATRYFISVHEAAERIIECAELPSGTYVPNMGVPVRLGSLACLHGAKNFSVIGLRPGEKKHEELFVGACEPTDNVNVWRDAA